MRLINSSFVMLMARRRRKIGSECILVLMFRPPLFARLSLYYEIVNAHCIQCYPYLHQEMYQVYAAKPRERWFCSQFSALQMSIKFSGNCVRYCFWLPRFYFLLCHHMLLSYVLFIFWYWNMFLISMRSY